MEPLTFYPHTIFSSADNETEVDDDQREVFLLQVIRKVTEDFSKSVPLGDSDPENDGESDISNCFNIHAREIWKHLDHRFDNGIISLFDKSVSWNSVLESLNSELEFDDKKKAESECLFGELQKKMEQFPMVSSRNDCVEGRIFPKRSDLESYLSSYYSLTGFLFENENWLYKEHLNFESIKTETICELLTHIPAKNGCSIYSPYCAEALLTLYDSIPYLYGTRAFTANTVQNIFVNKMINSAFAVKSFRRFRNYVIRDSKQALLSCENTDRFLEKKNSVLSSYELFRPVRFAGKIRRHTISVNHPDLEIPITIIGAVYINHSYFRNMVEKYGYAELEKHQFNEQVFKSFSHEMFQLYRCLGLGTYTRDQKYKIEVLINKNSFPVLRNKVDNKTVNTVKGTTVNFTLSNMKIIFRFEDYNDVCQKKQIDNIIIDNQLLLVLDCPFIYENTKLALENTMFADYFVTQPSTYSSETLSLSQFGPIQKIQMQLNTALLNNLGRIGMFDRKLKEPFLEYISRAVGQHDNSEAFVFISSQRSVNLSRYMRQYAVRTEKYNGKEIGLLHFGVEPQCFFDGQKNNSVEFTFWSIIVNTDVPLIETWKEYLGLPEKTCAEDLANKVIIKLEWKNNKTLFDSVTIHIAEEKSETGVAFFESSKRKTKMIDIIHSYFDTIFNSEIILRSIIECMQNSFYNVFFSQINNAYKAIAFQQLREKLAHHEKIEIETVDFVDEIDYEDTAELAGYRKLFIDVVANFFQEIPSQTVRDVLVTIMKKKNIDVYEVYDSIIDVCQSVGIEDSMLYKNTQEARGKL